MHFAALEFFFAGHSLHKQFVFSHAAAFKMIGGCSIEQDDCTFRWLATDGGRNASDLADFSETYIVRSEHYKTSLFNFSSTCIALQKSHCALHFTGASQRRISIPSVARQSAHVGDPLQLAAALRDYMHAHFEVTVSSFDSA